MKQNIRRMVPILKQLGKSILLALLIARSPESIFAQSCGSDNVADAKVTMFVAWNESGGNRLIWETATEEYTESFQILRASTPLGPFTTVVDSFPSTGTDSSGSYYEYLDNTGSAGSYYQLVETETNGRELTCSPVIQADEPEGNPEDPTIYGGSGTNPNYAWNGAAGPSPNYNALIICPDSWINTLVALRDHWDNFRNLYTSLVGLSQTGASASDIKSYIMARPSVEYVLLVGDPYSTGGTYMPTHQVWARAHDQMVETDAPFGDRDGDGLSDVALGRWPASSTAELAELVQKSIQYDFRNPAEGYRRTMVGFTLDLSLNDVDPALAAEASEKLMDFTPSGMTASQFKASQIPCCYENRKTTLVNALNSGAHIAWSVGTFAYSHSLIWFLSAYSRLNEYCENQPFHPRNEPLDLSIFGENGSTPFWLALSCDLGDVWNERYGCDFVVIPSIAQMLLTAKGKGALAWVAPTGPSYQLENEKMGVEILQRIDPTGSNSIGQACMEAAKSLVSWRPTSTVRASSYILLGDPTIRLAWATPTDVSVETSSGVVGMSAYPNPSNGAIAVRLSVPLRGPASLTVYDVAGRRVRSLFQGAQVEQTTVITWDQLDDSGAAVGSGIYVLRFHTDNASLSQKVVVLK